MAQSQPFSQMVSLSDDQPETSLYLGTCHELPHSHTKDTSIIWEMPRVLGAPCQTIAQRTGTFFNIPS